MERIVGERRLPPAQAARPRMAARPKRRERELGASPMETVRKCPDSFDELGAKVATVGASAVPVTRCCGEAAWSPQLPWGKKVK